MDEQRPLRVLHIVGSMNRGGVETWLMHVLRHVDRQRLRMDFVVATDQPGAYDDEARELGCRIIPCLHPQKPWLHARTFTRILRVYGPYDVVHSHEHFYSGYVLRVACAAGIPVRIAHSHNDTTVQEAGAGLLRRMYLRLMRSWIDRYATHGLAASRQAASDLFGPTWFADPRWRILHYGIDLAPFQQALDPVAVRADLGIPPDAFVIGHVGRFDAQKNHAFVLAIAAAVAQREPTMRLVCIGEGTLRPAVERLAMQMGLANRVHFLGSRPDVPRLMRGAMDVFLFPSLFEGLGIVLLEAQAAGLPCVYSDVVPDEADLVAPLVRRLPLAQSPVEWAEAVLAARGSTRTVTQMEAARIVEESSFNIATSAANVEEFYHGGCFTSTGGRVPLASRA